MKLIYLDNHRTDQEGFISTNLYVGAHPDSKVQVTVSLRDSKEVIYKAMHRTDQEGFVSSDICVQSHP